MFRETELVGLAHGDGDSGLRHGNGLPEQLNQTVSVVASLALVGMSMTASKQAFLELSSSKQAARRPPPATLGKKLRSPPDA